MSSPREPWWPYVKNVLRSYPALRRELDALQAASVTVRYDRSGGGGAGPQRTTERSAMRELPPARMREIEAVRRAIRITGHKHDGKCRNDIIRLVYFRRRYNLSGAAWACHVSESTARRWHGEFLRLVAEGLGLR